tara:strand:- start:999 stop:1556 length:558 start_codon:yes stop_codon:yes gene_type:complete
MATFLDVGLFQYFNVIFPVLLIFAVILALLQKTKILGTNPTINAIIAVAVSFMALLSKTVIKLVNFMAPWFVLVLIFVILLLLIFQTLGATEKNIANVLAKEKIVHWSIIGVGLLILMAGLGSIWGQQLTSMAGGGPVTTNVTSSSTTGNLEQNLYATFYNPKVLGLVFVFLIAVFAIAFLAGGT